MDSKKAKRIQDRLKKRIVFKPFSRSRFLAAGIDVSYKKAIKEASAAIVVLSYPQMEIREVSLARMSAPFPYVPGLLAFREAPSVLKAWKKLKTEPDLLFIDGHGLAHPRGFGLACHLGVLLGKPSIGCAKKHLYGDMTEPSKEKGAYSYVTDPKTGEKIGAVLRSRGNVSCIYISTGHLMDLSSAIKTTSSLTHRYRLPEPTRLAHTYSRKGWE